MSNPHDADGRGTGSTGSAPVAASAPLSPGEEAAAALALTAPPAPPAAGIVFGDHLAVAERFAALLADTGVSHGLIGPRELPILWERHILNCAVAQAAFPAGAEVIDVGSGAGLPGLALAIARPDLTLHLIEPMLRRTTWLSESIGALGLANARVHRGRAEELRGRLQAPYATARAVARIDKLARWTFPLLTQGGTLVALKGSQAAEELESEERELRRLGMVSGRVATYGADVLEVPTVTLELTVGAAATARGRRHPARTRRGGRSRGPEASPDRNPERGRVD
jgi:16S rRNA (guanine527-N7)-methyltransferase